MALSERAPLLEYKWGHLAVVKYWMEYLEYRRTFRHFDPQEDINVLERNPFGKHTNMVYSGIGI